MRTVKLGVVLLLAAVLVEMAPAALAAGRVALVVGNGTYAHIGRLANPVNDASEVSAALARLGFDVTLLLDATRDTMNDALFAFSEESDDADIALVFYAGHGLETTDGRNPSDTGRREPGGRRRSVCRGRVARHGSRCDIRGPSADCDLGCGPQRPDRTARRSRRGEPEGEAGIEGRGSADRLRDPAGRLWPRTVTTGIARTRRRCWRIWRSRRWSWRRCSAAWAAAVYAATEGEQHPAVLSTLTEPGTIRLADPDGRFEDGTDAGAAR